MYGYLDKDYDWLNFSVYSMLIKNTRYKPHNVYGYIHFENINENESSIKISNERAYFIENGAFKKFQEIMKNVITSLAFNIDVAEKNNWFNKTIVNNTNSIRNTNTVSSSKSFNSKQSDSLNNTKKNYSSEDANNTKNKLNGISNPNNNLSSLNTPKENLSPSSEQTPVIKIEKKPQFNFFNTSTVIKLPGKIDIEYNELISQLSRLDYKNFYLIYGIAFRAILEDISKKYLNSRGINLCGDFGQNIRLMIDDISMVIKDPSMINNADKINIESIFGGYHSFRNFLDVTGPEFYANGKQGIKATKLNSFVHAPRWMEIEEAENIANNIIIPLYIASKEIINKIKK